MWGYGLNSRLNISNKTKSERKKYFFGDFGKSSESKWDCQKKVLQKSVTRSRLYTVDSAHNISGVPSLVVIFTASL